MEGTDPRMPIAYLGGMGRSGSTLLSRALDQVPGFVAVGELSNLWHQSLLKNTLCGCGQPFSECPFWQAVGREAFGGWDRVDAEEVSALRRRVERVRYLPLLLAPRASPAFRRDVERYREVTLALYGAIRTVSGCDVVVDNSKLPSRAALLRALPQLDFRVVHLVRSSYGVCYSWAKQTVRPDSQQAMMRFSVAKSAYRWTAFNSAFEMLARRGLPTLSLRYEDFVGDPGGQLRRILDFLDQPRTDEQLAFVEGATLDLAPDHSVWGNPMRMRVGRETVRLDEQWRTALTPRQKRIIGALTAPGMRRYGYTSG